MVGVKARNTPRANPPATARGERLVTSGAAILRQIEADRRMIPASNMKLLTTAAALDENLFHEWCQVLDIV